MITSVYKTRNDKTINMFFYLYANYIKLHLYRVIKDTTLMSSTKWVLHACHTKCYIFVQLRITCIHVNRYHTNHVLYSFVPFSSFVIFIGISGYNTYYGTILSCINSLCVYIYHDINFHSSLFVLFISIGC